MIGVGTGCLATMGAMAPHVSTETMVQMGALLAAGGPFGQFRGLEFGGFGGCGRGAAESVRHPELIGRIRTVRVLNGFEQVLHTRSQQRGEFGGRQAGRDRFSDGDGDRNLRPPHIPRVILGPDALSTPNDVRDDRHIGGDGHARRTRLELLEFKTATDRRLRVHPDQFTGLQCPHRRIE